MPSAPEEERTNHRPTEPDHRAGNQNAAKPADERKEEMIYVRLPTADKRRWTKAAVRQKQTLSAFIIDSVEDRLERKGARDEGRGTS